jgi:Cu(I)/Ag(I) efflux system membrane fusion protein
VTSAQFLIDSESSLSAGFTRMQEAEPAKAIEAKAGPQGEGEVKSILPDGSKITISHGPIPEFNWPAMTMEFTVGPGVSVQGIAPGDRVRFGVAQAPDGTYTATAIERLGGTGKAS